MLRIKQFYALGKTCNLVATPTTRKRYTEICSYSKIFNDARNRIYTIEELFSKIRLIIMKKANMLIITYTGRPKWQVLNFSALITFGFVLYEGNNV